jgi:type I restriction enzyme S subunit
MATNQGFKSFMPDPNRVSAKYLYHWLRANRATITALGVGVTFKEVSKAIVSNIEISLPDLAEQRRIAAVLDKVQELTSSHQEAIDKLLILYKSLAKAAFAR